MTKTFILTNVRSGTEPGLFISLANDQEPDSTVPAILPDPKLAPFLAQGAKAIFTAASKHAQEAGLILADTKFEFGLLPPSPDNPSQDITERVILIDEVLTPDSSRFWLASEWAEGKKMTGLDKQYLRDWLKGGESNWDGKTPLEIPDDVINATWERYKEAWKRITGRDWADEK
jgi:phosphoribosylaminoimidazole-succinocarboxamide synthase